MVVSIMSTSEGSEESHLEDVIEDLKLIFEKDEIGLSEVDELEEELQSEEVHRYLLDLRDGSAPESALREELMAGAQSVLSNFFFERVSPEVSTEESGFIDYRIAGPPPMLLELKSLFRRKTNSRGDFSSLEQEELDWRDHQDQVEKYRTDNEFLILTNLKTWYFFSRKSPEPINEEPIEFDEFYQEYTQRADLRDYLRRIRGRKSRSDLDSQFFDSLNQWIEDLGEIEFEDDISDDEKVENIVNLINKFVFIQTLDDYFVIDFQWIQETWNYHDHRWKHIGKNRVLEEFFKEINNWFYAYYDTELFKRDIYDKIDKSDENIDLLYDKLGLVLGLAEWQSEAEEKGITNYDYKQIDEDIFGKAYETYLAEVREEQGIYYTPRYVSQSIVEDTVGTRISEIADQLEEAVENESWDEAEDVTKEFTELRVLDPACGSGSFLVKAFNTIRDEYDRVFEFISEERQSQRSFSDGTLSTDSEDEEAIENLKNLQQILGYTENERGDLDLEERDLVSKIVLRHIHGNDLDRRALDVAKLNIWLEVIKRDPEIYQYDRVPEADGYVLPDLELNLGHGDSLVGLPEEQVAEILNEEFGEEMEEVLRVREEYIQDPTDQEPITQASETIASIRNELDSEFEEYVETNPVPDGILDKTIPFYWPLQFWHVFRDSDGFDCIIENPPWLIEGKDDIKSYLTEAYDYQSGQPDLYRFFLEKSFNLGTRHIGMVTPNTWFSIPGAQGLRDEFLHNSRLENVAFVPDSAFKDVSQNIVTFIQNKQKSPSIDNTTTEDDPMISVGNLDTKGTFRKLRSIPSGDIEPPEYHINLYVGKEEKEVSTKMEQGATKLEDITDVTVGYQLYHNEIHSDDQINNEVFHSDTKENDNYVVDTRSNSLNRYTLNIPENSYVDKSAEFFRIPPDKFLENKKILLREVPSKKETGLIAAISNTELLFPKSMISVLLTDDNYDYEHILGLLNSRLLYLQSLVKGEKMGQDLFPRVSLTQLRSLSIKGTTQLTPYVKEMETLSLGRHKFVEEWEQKSETLKITDRDLAEILINDKNKIRRGDRDETWTVDVSFYPDENKEILEKEYSEYVFVGDSEEPILEIYGVDSNVEELIYRIEFKNRELMEMVYLSMESLFDSRSTVDHLKHILEKTSVPIIRPNVAENTVNIIEEVEREIDRWSMWDETPYSDMVDIIKIDNMLSKGQTKLDAIVFKLYDINLEEARTILEILDIREMVAKETLSKLVHLKLIEAEIGVTQLTREN